MSARSDLAIRATLQRETGKFTDDPDDAGGATRWGITLNVYREFYPNATVNDIRNLTLQAARLIYFRKYWMPLYEKLDQRVADKIFDTAVNQGPSEAHKEAQRSCTVLGHPVDVDGDFGPDTCAAVNACDPLAFLGEYRKEELQVYQEIVQAHPEDEKFLKGWENRAES